MCGVMSFPGPDVVVGRSARVTLAIPGGPTPGEVLVRVRGGTETYMAFAESPVEEGAEVVVLADRGGRMLSVAPL